MTTARIISRMSGMLPGKRCRIFKERNHRRRRDDGHISASRHVPFHGDGLGCNRTIDTSARWMWSCNRPQAASAWIRRSRPSRPPNKKLSTPPCSMNLATKLHRRRSRGRFKAERRRYQRHRLHHHLHRGRFHNQQLAGCDHCDIRHRDSHRKSCRRQRCHYRRSGSQFLIDEGQHPIQRMWIWRVSSIPIPDTSPPTIKSASIGRTARMIRALHCKRSICPTA